MHLSHFEPIQLRYLLVNTKLKKHIEQRGSARIALELQLTHKLLKGQLAMGHGIS